MQGRSAREAQQSTRPASASYFCCQQVAPQPSHAAFMFDALVVYASRKTVPNMLRCMPAPTLHGMTLEFDVVMQHGWDSKHTLAASDPLLESRMSHEIQSCQGGEPACV